MGVSSYSRLILLSIQHYGNALSCEIVYKKLVIIKTFRLLHL